MAIGSCCSACRVECCLKLPGVRMFSSAVCSHPVCEPCMTRLLQQGGAAYPCPDCGESVRAEDLAEAPPRPRASESSSEAAVRHQISSIYCKREEDFLSPAAYNDYLEQREGIINKLVILSASPDEAQTGAAWPSPEKFQKVSVGYRGQKEEQILRQPRKKFQDILAVIEGQAGTPDSSYGMQPFRKRNREILIRTPNSAPRTQAAHCCWSSPFAPSPLREGGPAGIDQQISGGGQLADASLRKARHFFFSGLVGATSSRLAASA